MARNAVIAENMDDIRLLIQLTFSSFVERFMASNWLAAAADAQELIVLSSRTDATTNAETRRLCARLANYSQFLSHFYQGEIAKAEQYFKIWKRLPEVRGDSPQNLIGRARLNLQTGRDAQAEQDLRTALDISRTKGAKTIELRARFGLAGVLESQGQAGQAVELLTQFVEDFGEQPLSIDLQQAKTLIGKLTSHRSVARINHEVSHVSQDATIHSLAGLHQVCARLFADHPGRENFA